MDVAVQTCEALDNDVRTTRFLGLEPEEILVEAARRERRRTDTAQGVAKACDDLERLWTFRCYVLFQRFVDWQQAKIDDYFRRKLLKGAK